MHEMRHDLPESPKRPKEKKMKISVILMIMFIVGCSTAQIKTAEESVKKHGINKEFNPYVDKFISISKGAIDKSDFQHTYMGFKEFEGNTVGTCWAYPVFKGTEMYFAKEIEIDEYFWKYASDLEKEELMFHEFGHCYLFRPHTEISPKKGFVGFLERLLFKIGILEKKGFLEDGCPASYMYPYTLSNTCIEKHYKYYMDELFNFIEEVETTVTVEQCYKTL